MKKVLFIVSSRGFQPIEYGIPRQILEDEDIQVFTSSDKSGTAISSDGSPIKVDFVLEDVNVQDFDGVFIIGGPGAMEHLDNDRTYRIIHEIDRKVDAIYGAICISTRILAHADVLEARRVTGWDGDHKIQGILSDYKAHYIAEPVIIDRNIITAKGPDAAQEFGEAIRDALYPRKKLHEYKFIPER